MAVVNSQSRSDAPISLQAISPIHLTGRFTEPPSQRFGASASPSGAMLADLLTLNGIR